MKFEDKEILYSDNHLLIAVKPAGLLTQPVYGKKENLQDQIKQYLKKSLGKKSIFIHPIHRLDKVVSGIVVFARSSKALSRLQKDVREKRIIRKYTAIVEGTVHPEKGLLEHYLIHGSHRAIIAKKNDPKAKLARLSYQVIQSYEDSTLIEITLETGRYHQIRVQFSAIGHPIVGDKKYGAKNESETINLHNSYVKLNHPILKEKMVFRSKPEFIKH